MLKSARVKNGYSQEYLSVILKVSSSRISRWERGKTAMTLDQILMYASKVGIQSTKILTYSSFCRLKSSLHSIFTHVSRIQYTFSTKLMV